MRIGMKRKVIMAVSGYARAGKDTFADFVNERIPMTVGVARMKFAGPLRRATLAAFKELGLAADPWTEDPKEKEALRPLLVSLGEYARSKNPAVFANKLAGEIDELFTNDRAEFVMVTDLRYANENLVLSDLAHRRGYEYYWVHVVRLNRAPANASEGVSIRELTASGQPDWECYAGDGELNIVEMVAKDFTRTVLPHEWFTTNTSK